MVRAYLVSAYHVLYYIYLLHHITHSSCVTCPYCVCLAENRTLTATDYVTYIRNVISDPRRSMNDDIL